MTGRHEVEGPSDAPAADHESRPRDDRPSRHRRVTTEAVPGSDPTPSPGPPQHDGTENDERLKDDKPPHWG